MIIEFSKQDPVTDEFILSLSAGRVSQRDYGFQVAYEQMGAQGTFSIGQPVYNIENQLMGFLSIGLYESLDVHIENKDCHGENIPAYFWRIDNPTSACQHGEKVYTFWQRWAEVSK